MNLHGKKILLIGDSLSEGEFSPGGTLAQLMGLGRGATVTVKAVKGRSMASWLSAGKTVLEAELAKKPDLVVVFLGTNDAASLAAGGAAEGVEKAYGRMRAMALGVRAEILVLGPPALPSRYLVSVKGVDRAVDLEAGAAEVRKIQAELFNTGEPGSEWLDLRPLTEDIRTPKEGRTDDGVHFTLTGAKKLTTRIGRALGLLGKEEHVSDAVPAKGEKPEESGGAGLLLGVVALGALGFLLLRR